MDGSSRQVLSFSYNKDKHRLYLKSRLHHKKDVKFVWKLERKETEEKEKQDKKEKKEIRDLKDKDKENANAKCGIVQLGKLCNVC